MASTLRATRRRKGRPRLRVEQLEPRLVLSADTGLIDPGMAVESTATEGVAETSTPTQAGPFTVALTDPAPGSVLSASPTTLTLGFSHQVHAGTLAVNDVFLVQLAEDGSVIWFTGLGEASLDPMGTQA